MESKRDQIITSAAADRMLNTVSPIYDEAYVGCWIFEVLGREADRLLTIIGECPEQLFVETASWAMELWERRYGITPLPSDTLDERRKRVAERRALRHSFTPFNLEQYIKVSTGLTSKVRDNIGAYTFGIDIVMDADSGSVDVDSLLEYINAHKPSHISVSLAFAADTTIEVSESGRYFIIPHLLCGTARCGTNVF